MEVVAPGRRAGSLCVSGRDRVELGDVVHHGRLQGDLLHEHGRGGDVLDLSLQEDFVCLGWRGGWGETRRESKCAPA